LYLTIDPSGNKRWTFLFQQRGKQQEAGLGGLTSVPLTQAREIAASFRADLAAGLNSIVERRGQRRLQTNRRTFGQVAENFLAAHQASWGNAKHQEQWKMTLEIYAQPLWDLPVEQVDTAAVLNILQPLWSTIPETASRLRGRIEAVLDAARVAGYIGKNEANPARWKGHLEHLLPKARQIQSHHSALPYPEVPAFMRVLRQHPSMVARALEFLILTVGRTSEVLLATWPEMDLATKVWTIPAARMKAKREHRVPLSSPALTILIKLATVQSSPFVFPGPRRDTPLGSTTLIAWLHRQGIKFSGLGWGAN
jgi:integrase